MSKRHLTLAITAVAIGAGLVFAAAAPAQAINQASCAKGTVGILYDGGKICYANRGTAQVRLHGVTRISAGSNDVVVTLAGPGTTVRVNRGQVKDIFQQDATKIQIF